MRLRHVVPLIAVLIVEAFVLCSWSQGGGIPYLIDGNETSLSYVHALNMVTWTPRITAYLTTDATDRQAMPGNHLYTHNPNGPRYVHYLLLLAGIERIETHVLLIGATISALSVVLAWVTFGTRVPALIGLAVLVLDYPSFLAWTTNTYRVFGLALFWAAVLVCIRPVRLVWVFVVFFLLWQYEYGFAIMASFTATVAALLTLDRRECLRRVVVAASGALASVAVFGCQVWLVLGTNEMVRDFGQTVDRRGGVDSVSTVWYSLAHIFHVYGPVVTAVVVYGVLSSAWRLWRCREHRLAPALCLGSVVGLVMSGTLLHGYYMDAFILSALPVFGPTVALSFVVLAEDLGWLGWWRLTFVLPMLYVSWTIYHPPFSGAALVEIREQLRGQAVVAPGFQRHLVHALTGGNVAPLLPTTLSRAGRVNLRRWGGRDPVYAVCLAISTGQDVLIHGHDAPVCDGFVAQMEANETSLVSSGDGWWIYRVQGGRE